MLGVGITNGTISKSQRSHILPAEIEKNMFEITYSCKDTVYVD